MAVAPLNIASVDRSPQEAFLTSGLMGGLMAGFLRMDLAPSSVPLSAVGRAFVGGFLYTGTLSAVSVITSNAIGDRLGQSLLGRIARVMICALAAFSIAPLVPYYLGLALPIEIMRVIDTVLIVTVLFLRLSQANRL